MLDDCLLDDAFETAKRQAERQRKRKYRARKQSELHTMRSMLQQHQATLRHLVHAEAKPKHRDAVATACQLRVQAYRSNQALRRQVSRQDDVCKALLQWASTPLLPQRIPRAGSSPWTQWTLVADPVARRCGYEWLSDRVYHSAMQVHRGQSSHPVYSGSIEDQAVLTVHTNSTDGQTNISAMETQIQSTVCHPFMDIAVAMWEEQIVAQRGEVERRQEVANIAGATMMYQCLENSLLGTTMRVISKLYHEAGRSTITHTFVLEDELMPMKDHELRPHGFGWSIFEHVTDGVTLVRQSSLQFTPVTATGNPISLAENGRIFGMLPHGVEFPDAYVARLHTAVDTLFKSSYMRTLKRVEKQLDDRAAAAATTPTST